MLTWLLQLIVDWAYSLDYGVGTLQMCDEFVTGIGEKQEHAVSGLKFPWLSGAVLDTLLFILGHLNQF